MMKNRDFGGNYNDADTQAIKMLGLIIMTIILICVVLGVK